MLREWGPGVQLSCDIFWSNSSVWENPNGRLHGGPNVPLYCRSLASLKKKPLTKSRVPPPELQAKRHLSENHRNLSTESLTPPCRLSEEQQHLLDRAIDASRKINVRSPVSRSTIEQVKQADALWKVYAASLTSE
jgi:hypothetical protein